LTETLDSLRHRATVIRDAIGRDAIDVIDSDASVGGGAFPTARIPSVALGLSGSPSTIEQRLRGGDPSVVARVADDRVIIDLRTVFPSEDADVTAAIRTAL